MNEKKFQVSKVVFFQTPCIAGHPVVSTETRRNSLPHPTGMEESFWKGGEPISSPERGPVAQRIRARGYEPRCRGFESLLAQDPSKREGLFIFVWEEFLIRIADAKQAMEPGHLFDLLHQYQRKGVYNTKFQESWSSLFVLVNKSFERFRERTLVPQ